MGSDARRTGGVERPDEVELPPTVCSQKYDAPRPGSHDTCWCSCQQVCAETGQCLPVGPTTPTDAVTCPQCGHMRPVAVACPTCTRGVTR